MVRCQADLANVTLESEVFEVQAEFGHVSALTTMLTGALIGSRFNLRNSAWPGARETSPPGSFLDARSDFTPCRVPCRLLQRLLPMRD